MIKKITSLMRYVCFGIIFLSAGGMIAQTGTLFESFGGTALPAGYTLSDGGTATIENSLVNVNMALVAGNTYRTDLWYNLASSPDVSTLAFAPTADQYIAIKFMGARPEGALKFEMKSAAGAWFNSQWNWGPDGDVVSDLGNHIYYFKLTNDISYNAATAMQSLHFIVADNPTSQNYKIDWIGTYESVAAIEAIKNQNDIDPATLNPVAENALFESFNDNMLPAAYTLSNGGTATVANSLVSVDMALVANNTYRADIWYNLAAAPDVSTFDFVPATDQYIAVKFMGARPEGALKFEMKSAAGTWYNSQWNWGPDGDVVSGYGNHIYYFKLTNDATYNATTAMQSLHFIVADNPTSQNYKIDWIGTYESVAAIEAIKNQNDIDPASLNPVGENSLFESFDQDMLPAGYTLSDGGTATVQNSLVNVNMALVAGNTYRTDLWYNLAGSPDVNTFSFVPATDQYIAIKFMGARPEGALKYEMKSAAGAWFNSQWNWGPNGDVVSSHGNHIYYFKLTNDPTYTATTAMQSLHFIVADNPTSQNYKIDWIGTFSSVAAIEAAKDINDIDPASLSVNTPGLSSKIIAYAANGHITFSGLEGQYHIEAYNLLGQRIANTEVNEEHPSFEVTKGICLLTLSNDKITARMKILVK